MATCRGESQPVSYQPDFDKALDLDLLPNVNKMITPDLIIL